MANLIKQFLSVTIIMLVCFTQAYALDDTQKESYRLGQGDRIIIKVYEQPDLTIETQLNDRGTINFPFIGSVNLQGVSVEQAQELIYAGLKDDYLVDPNVFVSVIEYRPFYIHGYVNRAGGYPYQPGMTLSQAIALAGGMTERGSKEKIYITREGKVQSLQKASFDSPIQAGDTIVINQRFF